MDVPSLMPMWRLDWRSLMAMPEPIFPGAIHVVGSTQEAPRAIEKLVASVAPDGLIGLWGGEFAGRIFFFFFFCKKKKIAFLRMVRRHERTRVQSSASDPAGN